MKFISSLFLLLVVFSTWTCTTDFVLEAEWEDIPVVYAFINQGETAHYVRVEKAFLEPGGDARAIAQIADSLYYENAIVQIEKVNTGQKYTLQKVDGNLEGYVREEGPFATAPNYLYKIPGAEIGLTGGQKIRFILDRGDNKPLVTAETVVLPEMILSQSTLSNPINFDDYNKAVNPRFNPGPDAVLFDVRWIIHYKEARSDDPSVFEPRQVIWVIDPSLERTGTNTAQDVRIESRSFFQFIGSNLPATPNAKKFESIEMVVTAAGQEMADFLQVSQANLGITSTAQVPSYTNLSEGRGIFTSRSTLTIADLKLRQPALDSLETGIYTKHLNFIP